MSHDGTNHISAAEGQQIVKLTVQLVSEEKKDSSSHNPIGEPGRIAGSSVLWVDKNS